MAILKSIEGVILRGPPYTKKEDAAFYKRIGSIKSLTVASPLPSERKAQRPKAPKSQRQRQEE